MGTKAEQYFIISKTEIDLIRRDPKLALGILEHLLELDLPPANLVERNQHKQQNAPF